LWRRREDGFPACSTSRTEAFIFQQDKAVAPPQFTPPRNAGRGNEAADIWDGFPTFEGKCHGSSFETMAPVLAPENKEMPQLCHNWWLSFGSFAVKTRFWRLNMSETKTRIHTRIAPETERKIAAAMPLDNCQSQNEFVEKALHFYCDYLTAGDCTTVLPPIYLTALKGTVQDTENRISRLLFKLAVEMDMMMNVLAAGMEISEEQLEKLRVRCVHNVKKTNGSVTLDGAVEYQRGGR